MYGFLFLDSITLNGHEFEQTPGDNGGQRSLACCSPWLQRVGHDLATEQQQHPKLDVVSNISTLKISRMEILVNCLDLFTREAL